jgi:hypothetical protein
MLVQAVQAAVVAEAFLARQILVVVVEARRHLLTIVAPAAQAS